MKKSITFSINSRPVRGRVFLTGIIGVLCIEAFGRWVIKKAEGSYLDSLSYLDENEKGEEVK